tara:strand:- start:140 stop:478 length:339 start_codon:yes stop_codon:yes gene_type:complete
LLANGLEQQSKVFFLPINERTRNMSAEPRPVNISAAFTEMHLRLKDNDWQSAGIIARYIKRRTKEEDLFISSDEKNLLITALTASDADLHHDGYPDDSDRNPNTGIPYGEID